MTQICTGVPLLVGFSRVSPYGTAEGMSLHRIAISLDGLAYAAGEQPNGTIFHIDTFSQKDFSEISHILMRAGADGLRVLVDTAGNSRITTLRIPPFPQATQDRVTRKIKESEGGREYLQACKLDCGLEYRINNLGDVTRHQPQQ